MIIGMIIWLPWGHDKPAVQVTGVRMCIHICGLNFIVVLATFKCLA